MRFLRLASALVLASSASLFAQTQATPPAAPTPNIRDLAWLIGTWEFTDRALPAAGFEYEERGTRTCAWALDDRYIRCESRGTSRNKARTYVSYINWNGEVGHFEMVDMFGNTPSKSISVIRASSGGHVLDIRHESKEPDGTISRSWQTMTYNGSDAVVWESRSNMSTDQPDFWPIRYRDDMKRVK